MYGIWLLAEHDWLREARSSGFAVLAFDQKAQACRRAARNFGFPSYTAARKAGWCIVLPLPAVKKKR